MNEQLAIINQRNEEEAEKIFDWILNLMEADNKNKKLRPIELRKYYGDHKLKALGFENETYELFENFLYPNEDKLFESLTKVITRENGFKVTVEYKVYFGEFKADVIVVTVE